MAWWVRLGDVGEAAAGTEPAGYRQAARGVLHAGLPRVLAMPAPPRPLRGPALALLVANAAGAVGDLALLAQLARLPRGAVIADTRHGFEAYAPDGAVEGEMVEG